MATKESISECRVRINKALLAEFGEELEDKDAYIVALAEHLGIELHHYSKKPLIEIMLSVCELIEYGYKAREALARVEQANEGT